MRVDILHYVKLLLILLLTGSLVANAYGQNKGNESAENQSVQTVVLDKNTTIYQFALSHSMTVEAIIKLNPSLKNTDTLVQGSEVKILAESNKANTSSNNSTLPELGNGATTGSEVSALNSTGDFLLSAVPGSQMLTGTAEENAANAAIFAGNQEWENLSADKILENIENQAVNKVVGEVNQKINETASNFLGRFGKAEVSVSLDKEGQLSSYNLNILSPLYDKDESLIFSQVGVHEQGSGDDARVIGNFGLGYRYETNDWLAGANTFIDHDFTGNNTRLGLGAEYWRDNYKIATNAYMPLSNWKESAVMKNYEQLIYDERPAKGFDIRAQAYLPNYPQLGGSLAYEQYFGEEVDLFGIENRQKDPYSLSVGINYMPVPLLKTEVSHKMGKDGVNDTKVDLSLNVQLGTPIEEQLNPDNVAIARSLKGSRYDMVDRNYDIVFEYQKEDFSIELTGTNEAAVGDMIDVITHISSRSPIVKYEWFISEIGGERIPMLGNDDTLRFMMTSKKDVQVVVRVTTERGYQAESKPHLVKYLAGHSNSYLDVIKGTAEVIRFSEHPELSTNLGGALGGIGDTHKTTVTFVARDENNEPVDLSALDSYIFKWRVKGENDFNEIKPYDKVKFDFVLGDDVSHLNIIAVADESLIANSGTKNIEFVIMAKYYPEAIVNGVVTFIRPHYLLDELGIDMQNIRLEIWKLPNADQKFSVYEDKVSVSGLLDGQPIEGFSKPIDANSIYRAKIWTVDSEGKDKDVTEYFIKGLVWLYWDPNSKQEVTTVSTLDVTIDDEKEQRKYRALEECIGSPLFFTQTNNYEFNELGWGKILEDDNKKAEENRILNEQGLRLSFQFDFSAINEANPTINQCIPSNEYRSTDKYSGYIQEGTELKNKATSWSASE